MSSSRAVSSPPRPQPLVKQIRKEKLISKEITSSSRAISRLRKELDEQYSITRLPEDDRTRMLESVSNMSQLSNLSIPHLAVALAIRETSRNLFTSLGGYRVQLPREFVNDELLSPYKDLLKIKDSNRVKHYQIIFSYLIKAQEHITDRRIILVGATSALISEAPAIAPLGPRESFVGSNPESETLGTEED